MYQYEDLLRSALKISDNEILMPMDITNIQLRQKVVDKLHNKAKEISKQSQLSIPKILTYFDDIAYILDQNSLVLVLSLPDHLYFITVDPDDWKFVNDPVYH